MNNYELANKIFDCISDGYDDEEERDVIVKKLVEELEYSEGNNETIKLSLLALCERIKEIE